MWRIIAGIVIGLLLFFPGIVLLQWLAVDVFGLYQNMSLTDGCLVFIIILQCIIIVLQVSRGPSAARYPARLAMMGERINPHPDDEPPYIPPRPPKRGYDRD
jgi:hypothetical protein